MKYFTPELYAKFNSDSHSRADAADKEWERAINKYRRQIQNIRTRLPQRAQEFAANTCLHDAQYLGFLKVAVPGSAGELALVAVERSEELVLLIYVLIDEPSLGPRHPAKVFSEDDVHWLYDEFDAPDDHTCAHEILLSSGRILKILFAAFDLLTVQKQDFDRIRNGRLPSFAAT